MRLGASPIILQSSATTHWLFLPLPLSGGDVQIALMADQRGKLCPTGTYLFPKFVCLSVPTLPPPVATFPLPTLFPCQPPPNDRLSMGIVEHVRDLSEIRASPPSLSGGRTLAFAASCVAPRNYRVEFLTRIGASTPGMASEGSPSAAPRYRNNRELR